MGAAAASTGMAGSAAEADGGDVGGPDQARVHNKPNPFGAAAIKD